MKDLLKMAIEYETLNNQYGHVSCFDVPEKYEEMEELISNLHEKCKKFFNGDEYYAKKLVEILKTIAYECVNGNYNFDNIELCFYTQDDFIEEIVLSGMDESAKDMFDRLFYFMDIDHRVAWLKSNYLNPNPHAYHDEMVNFVIEVVE
jgi:hypothetical protein